MCNCNLMNKQLDQLINPLRRIDSAFVLNRIEYVLHNWKQYFPFRTAFGLLSLQFTSIYIPVCDHMLMYYDKPINNRPSLLCNIAVQFHVDDSGPTGGYGIALVCDILHQPVGRYVKFSTGLQTKLVILCQMKQFEVSWDWKLPCL